MTIGQRIKKRRKEIGINADYLAEKLGVSRSTVFRYESGDIEKMPIDIIKPIAMALHTNPVYLLGWDDSEDEEFHAPNLVAIETKQIPILGEIACGQLRYAEEDFQGYVECGAEIGADFALRCKGDSMINARILDGDLVFIRKQDIVENGDIAAVMEEDKATLKRYRRIGNTIILSPENPAYEDIIVNLDEGDTFHIIGKAVAFQSDVR